MTFIGDRLIQRKVVSDKDVPLVLVNTSITISNALVQNVYYHSNTMAISGSTVSHEQ